MYWHLLYFLSYQLEGIKENIIVGNKMPVGTGMKEPNGKYDIFDNGFDHTSFNFQKPLEISINIGEEEEEFKSKL